MARKETSFTLTGTDGTKTTVTLLDFVTPDDLIRVGLKAYVYEKKAGLAYDEPFSREVRDMLVLSRVTQG